MTGFDFPTPDKAPAEQPHWAVRTVNFLRPGEGWAVFLLAWAAAICLPAAAVDAGLVDGLLPTLWLSTLGLVTGWWLAKRPLRGWLAAVALFLAGLLADLAWGVHVLRLQTVVGLARQVGGWLAWRAGPREVPAPAITALGEQWAALSGYGERVGWWLRGLFSGQGAPDNLVVIGLAGLTAWALAAWAAWWVARRGQPFVGLLPTAALLAQHVYWAEDVRWALLIFLAAFALLLVADRLSRLTTRWERTGVDYSPELRLDVALAGAGITALTLVLAPTIPFLTSQRASEAFWRLFESPYRQVEESLGRSFAAGQPARSLVPAAGVAAGGLPRSHLLGAGPELADVVALRVRVRGLLPGQPLTWRGQTFAHYTGRGWDEPEPLTEVRLAAGEPWDDSPPPAGATPWVGTVTVVEAARAVLYTPGTPVSLDRPYVASLRGPGDLAAVTAPARPGRYTVLSLAPVTDPAALRRSGTGYPAAIGEHYLQLPADLDPRLVALVQAWTASAVTPYDRAVAIESELRRLPYTLDVPVPPADREVVAWFLFDLRRGYCDYFATAMTVLARLSGIPARLAVGYAAGAYDVETDTYTIRELDAHAWPELYFPGSGWTPFEPTPAFARPERDLVPAEVAPPRAPAAPPDLDAGLAELRGLAADNQAAERRAGLFAGLLAGLHGLLAAWALVGLVHLRQPRGALLAPAPLGAAYERLLAWGARLGRPPRPADTPREYVAALVGAGERAAARARWGRGRAAAAVAVLRREADALALDYERALFAAAEPAPGSGLSAHRRGLWAALRRLWLAQRGPGAARK